jgi:soluble P-type ATPase
MNEVESGLVLQGASANEDKLQKGVPETIELLEEAGIAVHMLTGDKEETAVNIAYATRLVNPGCELVLATNGHSNRSSALRGVDALRACAKKLRDPQPNNEYVAEIVLVVDDITLQQVLEATKQAALSANTLALRDEFGSSDILADFKEVVLHARALIACRCRPDQKAMLVQLIRLWDPSARVLAVGDGANDVDMIQSAHVGVGIAGKEGSQAVNACDFAVGQFHHLQRLLLVHGRWNYSRMSLLVSYQLYKSIINTMVQFYFSASTGWSGQKWYVEVYAQIFGLIIVQFPILFLAVLDRDVSSEAAQLFPELYMAGQRGKLLNLRTFAGWLLTALAESAVVYFFTVTATSDLTGNDGATPYIFQMGFIAFCAMVLVCTIRICSMMNLHFWFFQVTTALFVLIIIPMSVLLGALNADGLNVSGYQNIANSPTTWLLWLLLTIMVQLPWHIKINYRRIWAPSLAMLVSEVEAWGYRKLSKRELRALSDRGSAETSLFEKDDAELHPDGYVLSTAEGSDDGQSSEGFNAPASQMRNVFKMLGGGHSLSIASNNSRRAAALTALRSAVNQLKGREVDHGTLTAAGGNLWSLFATQFQAGTHRVGEVFHRQRLALDDMASSMSTSLAGSWEAVLSVFDQEESEPPITSASTSPRGGSAAGINVDAPRVPAPVVLPPAREHGRKQAQQHNVVVVIPGPSSPTSFRRAHSFQDILAGGGAGSSNANPVASATGIAAPGSLSISDSSSDHGGSWHTNSKSLFSQDPGASAWVAEQYSVSGRAASARQADASRTSTPTSL